MTLLEQDIAAAARKRVAERRRTARVQVGITIIAVLIIGYYVPMLTTLAVLYFVPLIVALYRRHHNTLAIFVLDLLLGWTVVGWVAALVWACTASTRRLS
jgi:hypothetical protein